MIGGPLLVLGLLLVLAAVLGDRVRARGRGAVASFLLGPFDPTAWRATWALVLGAVVEILAVSVIASIFSTGVSLLIVGVGVVFVGLGIEACRVVARMERARMRLVDPRPLIAHPYRPVGRTLRERAAATFLDVSRWRDVVYVFVAVPLAVLEAVLVVTLWTLAVGLLAVPLWSSEIALPASAEWFRSWGPLAGAAALALGLILLPLAAFASTGLARLHRAVVAGLLCVSEQEALARRVETLEGSRRAVLEVEASELRRIERDLHDGAQQRLVILSMDLAMAAERLESDPGGARTLVLEAQDQARTALAELRDLVRGIAPSILVDRGLVAAVGALAGRAAVPTAVSSTLPDGLRLPEAVERAAYFVVAEALTNVAKHARAARCEVRFGLERGGGGEARSLVAEVQDDGAGGAALVPGGGLAGLAGRVEALDGRLVVTGTPSGGTVVRAEIPLGDTAGVDSAPRA